jgi:FtsP/CotA-like multicopper oxidase with cupredoxin domain
LTIWNFGLSGRDGLKDLSMRYRASPATVDRRRFLRSSVGFGGACLIGIPRALAQTAPPMLTVGSRTIEVNKKAATVFSVLGPNGKPGIVAQEGGRFAGGLLNASGEPLQMHWHGQTKAPADQDRSRPGGGTLGVGETDIHDFELTPGTHWMHAHQLSEQQLLAAPMVTREKNAGDVQDAIVMLHDFAFRTPQEILAELTGSSAHSGHGAGVGAIGKALGRSHANDVRYDAYLANDRTLDDPEVVRVEKGGRVRLRIINGGTATAFFIAVRGLSARCIAVDGSPCQPARQPSYPLAPGQRIDLLVDIPRQGGSFPLLARVEAARFVTGIVLSTANAPISKLAVSSDKPHGMVGLGFETLLRASQPLPPKRPNKTFTALLGEGPGYRWTINGQAHGEHTAFELNQGERVEMTFENPTTMMHPMHLHGHHFQVVAIGRRRFAGAVRDTLIVPVRTPVTVAFDAIHKGAWFLHCHHLYHMATGMMTEVRVS